MWYVSKHYYDRLLPLSPQPRHAIASNQKPEPLPVSRLPQDVPPRVLQGLKALSVFLQGQARRLVKTDTEEFTFDQRRIAKENVPTDAIKSPVEHVKLFRALILRILGESEDEPTPVPALQNSTRAAQSQSDRKRKSTSAHPTRTKSFQGPSGSAATANGVPARSSTGPESKQDVNTVVTHEVLRRPPPEGSTEEGPEELAEIRVQTTVQEVSRFARGKDRVMHETRTKTEVIRRVIWSGVPPPPAKVNAQAAQQPKEMPSTSTAQNMAADLDSQQANVKSEASADTQGAAEVNSGASPNETAVHTDQQDHGVSQQEDTTMDGGDRDDLPASDRQDAQDIVSAVSNSAANVA